MPTATYLFYDDVLRATAVTILFNGEGKILVGHTLREDNCGGWQPPQGGIDETEINNPHRSFVRETWEEMGIRRSHLSFIAAANSFFSYHLPVPREGDKYTHITCGCEALLVRDDVVPSFDKHPKGEDPEFDEAKWIAPEELIDICPPHKQEIFRKITTTFRPISDALRKLNIPSVPPLGQVVKAAMADMSLQAAIASKVLVPALPHYPGTLVRQNKL
jgi:putative (di)nucleoside polyphosphate hydrolase